MRRVALVAAICAASSLAQASPLPPPISPASQGKLQCYEPKVHEKTCQSLEAYAVTPNGTIRNPATVLISTNPAITMTTVVDVQIKADQVCGVIRPQDIEAAEFTVNGGRATAAQAAKLREAMIASEKNLFGHEICTAYAPDGDAFIAKTAIDGVPQPKQDEKVIWVSPSDDYRVQP